MRIGHGYDVHRTAPGRRLVLCGVGIDCEFGLLAHSDGDVALHALTDALLGAAGLPDIGRVFPDTDDAWKDADSRDILRRAVAMVREKGFEPEYADVTVVAERPKLSPYIDLMREETARAMDIDPSRVNVKATTEEKLGFTGCGDGIAAHAVCLLRE